MNWLYLLINIGAISIPLWRSFDKRLNFNREFPIVFASILLAAIPFIIWDVIFTKYGVWGFNPNYLLGINLFGLPVEEILFFIAIPFACLFTYRALEYFVPNIPFPNFWRLLAWIIVAVLLFLAFQHTEKAYTLTTFILTAGLLIAHLLLKTKYLPRFLFTYAIILIPFFVVNGILTGAGIPEQIVWYNELEFMGLRMYTIPIEDTFYGLSLILLGISFYEILRK